MNINDIKKGLECCYYKDCDDCPYHIINKFNCFENKMFKDALNLINKLEKDCTDIANDYQEMGKFYNEEAEKNQQLNDRIAELKSENELLRSKSNDQTRAK